VPGVDGISDHFAANDCDDKPEVAGTLMIRYTHPPQTGTGQYDVVGYDFRCCADCLGQAIKALAKAVSSRKVDSFAVLDMCEYAE
jgi:hypothetical protein